MQQLLMATMALLNPETTTQLNPSSGTVALGNFTYIDRSGALPNNVTITRIGINATTANASAAVKIVLENSSTSHDYLYTQTVNHTGSGWENFILTTPFRVPSSGTYRIGAFNNTTNDRTDSVARTTIAGNQGVANGVTGTAATNVVIPLRYLYVP